MVSLVDLVGLFPALGVGEGVVELLGGEAHGLVTIGGVLQDREDGADLRDGRDPDTLGGHGVYGDSRGPVAVIEQDLGHQPTSRVADDDGGTTSSSMIASK